MIVREEEPLARHLPLRATEGCLERWVEVDDEAELVAFVRQARADKLVIRPIPPFCDALPPEAGLTGVGLRLGQGFEWVRDHERGVEVGASFPVCLLARRGFPQLAEAAGTVSDALEDGWLWPAVVCVRRFKGRGFEEAVEADPKGLVVSVVLRRGVRLSPMAAGTAFREPRRRGVELRELLRTVGVGELRLAGAALAEDDPAVIVNRGEASPRQLRLLLSAVKERVRIATGIDLEERLVAPGRGGRL